MADPDQLRRLTEETVDEWNRWKQERPHAKVDLSRANLSRLHLTEIDLRGANLSGVNFSEADLNDAVLRDANLTDASLGWAKLYRANFRGADLTRAILHQARMSDANFTGAVLADADLTDTSLNLATLRGASMCGAKLSDADLRGTDLRDANLDRADLHRVNLSHARVMNATLRGTILRSAILRETDMQGSDLSGADFRSANLQRAYLDNTNATGIRLWETLRAEWSITGIKCDHAFWDREAVEPVSYSPREFEKLYSEQTCIELFYQGGVSKFELNTLPALLHHLASLHPGADIRLKSIEETGGGARISIAVADADTETVDKIKADSMRLYQSQLALRENEILRLQIQKDYLENFVSEKLVRTMLTAVTPQNVFNAPVTGLVISSGHSRVEFTQTVNDNSALLSLLDKMIARRADLPLPASQASDLENNLDEASTEIRKPNPDKSFLARTLDVTQDLVSEALKKAAGKLGESAVTDWQSWLHQLGQFIHTLR